MFHWKRAAFAAIFIALAGGFYFAYRQDASESGSHEELELALRSQNEILQKSTEKALKNADHFLQDFLSRWKKHDASFELLLQLGDAPKQIIYDSKRFRATDFALDPSLYAAMERLSASKEAYSIYAKDAKFYFLLRGDFKGKNYVAAFERDSFFHFLGNSSAFRNWVVSGSGLVVYHPSARYMGADIANYRPVAAGLLALQEHNLKEVYSNSAGLDGLDTQLVWSSVPSLQLIFGSEWAARGKFSHKTGTSSGLLKISMGLLAIGFFFLGWALAGKRKNDIEVDAYEFDLEKLDQESKEFLWKAKALAEEAVEFGRKKEQELSLSQENARKYFAEASDSKILLELWNEMLNLVFAAPTVKQVWKELTRYFVEKYPGVKVIYYRYSNTSYALVPEEVAGAEGITENARAYLADARIFLGSITKLHTVEESQAFQAWNQVRTRHMPLANDKAFFLLVDANTASRGAYLFLVDQELASQEWFMERMNTLQDFVYRLSLLCELKQRLLQSNHAKSNDREGLASSPNNT